MSVKSLLVAIHVLAAVFWVGGILYMQLVMRKITEPMSPQERQAVMGAAFETFFRYVWIAVITLLATGLSVIYPVYGGFGNLPWITFRHIWVMLVLGILMMLVFAYVYFVPFRQLKEARREGDMKRAGGAIKLIRSFGTLNFVLGVSLIALVQLLQ